MPPARRRRPIPPAADAIQAAVDAVLAELARLETAEERARAATDLIALFDQGKRTVARARIESVVELLRAGWSLRAIAQSLDLSVNAVVQIRNEHLGRPRRRRPA